MTKIKRNRAHNIFIVIIIYNEIIYYKKKKPTGYFEEVYLFRFRVRKG